MLRVQKIVPRIPPRLLGPLIKLAGVKPFVHWSFNHYLQIAPPEFAAQGGTPATSTPKTPTPV
jgi:hypothetical protein